MLSSDEEDKFAFDLIDELEYQSNRRIHLEFTNEIDRDNIVCGLF